MDDEPGDEGNRIHLLGVMRYQLRYSKIRYNRRN